jgi:hypothetical protein
LCECALGEYEKMHSIICLTLMNCTRRRGNCDGNGRKLWGTWEGRHSGRMGEETTSSPQRMMIVCFRRGKLSRNPPMIGLEIGRRTDWIVGVLRSDQSCMLLVWNDVREGRGETEPERKLACKRRGDWFLLCGN